MKKFLSLALALIMTLSLVTISAGAAEYNDFTDKDEIQYEEAVAVLNKLGIITGYSEGDFRPEGELTRGAAAKIIVSLLIGPEAAEALPTTGNPYPDVPAGNVFAGYIGFCKTSKIISGYKDGTFRPNGTLTGYAFSKMLLGALGYKDEFEGLSGDGWTMNVANLGNAAGLFKRIDFKGGDTVNRETACLLALNTLKATMVQYTGGMNITTDAGSMVVNPTRTYVTSNQDYATHISNRKASNVGNAVGDTHYTVEFGEEHFRDLRMDKDHNGVDDFGRPSNVWSYKKVTIGTYPIEPDFVYTTQVTHNVDSVTDATKERALGLSGYDTETSLVGSEFDNSSLSSHFTTLYVNGSEQTGVFTSDDQVAEIADYTDNGTLVEVYVSDEDADFIEVVSVIKTQLMQVKRVGSDYVSLELYDGDPSDADGTKKGDLDGNGEMDDALYGYNQNPIDVNVNDVEVGDACYNDLKDMKAGDIVAVIPQTSTKNAAKTVKYDVAKVYVPETATGSLDRVDTFGTVTKGPNAIAVTVGGTEYKIALWNKDLYDIDGDSIKVTKKDVTIYLDEYGNAMLATDVGATTNYMVIGSYRQGLVNGQIITYANGWDINGNEISLNIGAGKDLSEWKRLHPIGTLVRYSSDVESNVAEWYLDKFGVFDIDYEFKADGDENAYNLKTSNSRIRLADYDTGVVNNTTKKITWDHAEADWASTNVWADSGIKFIYISKDSDGEIDSIEFKSGMQSASNDELSGKTGEFAYNIAEACVSLKASNTTINDESAVKAVVIKTDSSDASVNNLLYIARYHGSATRDNNGKVIQGYEVAMMNDEGKLEEDVVIYAERDLPIGAFARYTKATHEEDRFEPFYSLKGYGEVNRAASVLNHVYIDHFATSATGTLGQNKNFVFLNKAGTEGTNISQKWASDRYLYDGDGGAENLIDMRGANFYDLTQWDIDSASDLYDAMYEDAGTNMYRPIELALIFNDKTTNDSFRRAYTVIILSVGKPTAIKDDGTEPPTPPTDGDVKLASNLDENLVGTVSGTVQVGTQGNSAGKALARITLNAPDWAYTSRIDSNVAGTIWNAAVTYKVIRDDGETFEVKKDICVADHGNGITGGEYLKNATGTEDVFSGEITLTTTDEFNLDRPNQTWLAGHTASVEITDIQWIAAKVEYVGLASSSEYSAASAYLPVGENRAASLGFTWTSPTTISGGTNTYEVEGATVKTGESTELKGTYSSAVSLANLYATAGQKVTVTMTNAGATVSYKITVNGDKATNGSPFEKNVEDLAVTPVIGGVDASKLGKLHIESAETVTSGKAVTFIMKTAGATDSVATKLLVISEVQIGNGTPETKRTVVETNNTAESQLVIGSGDVTGDVKLTIKDVQIFETIGSPYVESAVISEDGKTITLTYNEEISKRSSGTNKIEKGWNNNGKTALDPANEIVTISGKTLTIQLNDAWNVNAYNTLTVEGYVTNAAGQRGKDCVITITQVNGVWSAIPDNN